MLDEHGFDRFAEARCQTFYAETRGRPSIPPGVYFRMLLIGYFELLERPFAHCHETGGMRRTHLKGHTRILKRLLIHVAGCNLSLVMRTLFGLGTPRGLQGLVFGLLETLARLVHAWRCRHESVARCYGLCFFRTRILTVCN